MSAIAAFRRFARGFRRGRARPASRVEQGYLRLFNDVPIGLYRTLADGEMVEVNPALAHILGYSAPDELIGTNAASHYLTADRDRLRRLIDEHGGVGSFEVALRRRDGTPCWVRMSARVIRDAHGNVACYEGAIQDVTELRRLGEKLLESEAQYRILFESNPQPMWVFDRRNFAFLAVNQAAQKHYGYSHEEFLAMTVLDIRPAKDREKFIDWYTRVAKLQEPPTAGSYGTWQHRRKNGTWISVDITSSPISFGRHDAILVVATDVTERERAREKLEAASRQLVRAQEAEQRHIAKELHDQIGQMLTALKFMLAESSNGGSIAPAVAAESRALVDQLMDCVRGLSLDLRPPALDRLGLVPALVGLLHRFTDRTHIEVDFAHSGLDRRFSSEIETAAFRVVQEALTNVARHAGVSRAAVRLRAGDQALSVQIADSGSGFDAEQALESRVAAGLAGMEERASAVGGRLTIDTAPAKGTRILAELPLGGAGEGER